MVRLEILTLRKLSRTLALESKIRYSHLRGALAVVKARPQRSFRSQLTQKLLMHVYADLVRISIPRMTCNS